jgi:HEPN domain-containing protein
VVKPQTLSPTEAETLDRDRWNGSMTTLMRWLPFFLICVFVACAQPPTKEIDITTERVARAREAEAHIYANSFLIEAETALAEARQNLDAKRYRPAVEAASVASIRADEAYARAILRKQRMERRARRQLREILALLDQARSRGADPISVRPLADRLGELERAFRRGGSPYEIFEAGSELKKSSLDLLAGSRSRSYPPPRPPPPR